MGNTQGNIAGPTGAAARISVWIVEDCEPFRVKLEGALAKLPNLACEGIFTDCASLLPVLTAETAPDVMLMDVNLPGMSGIECIGRIKAVSAKTEIVMLTVEDDQESIARAISAGATGYLLKTATMDEVRQSVLEVVNGGAPMSPRVARSVVGMVAPPATKPTNHGLSAREKEVLQLLVEGAIKKEVADQLSLSYHTVDKHVRAIYAKLGVRSLSAAVAKAVKDGIL